MKKIISALLVLTMIVSMVAALGINTSAAEANTLLKSYAEAKNGDKLLDLVFGQTTGVYQPIVFSNGDNATNNLSCYKGPEKITVAEDGKSFTLEGGDDGISSEAAGNLMYGGKIDGLKAGVDADGNPYQYTFTFDMLFNHDHKSNANVGVYFTMGETCQAYKNEGGRTIINMPERKDAHLGAYGFYIQPYKNDGSQQMRYHVIYKDGMNAKNGGDVSSKVSAEAKENWKNNKGEWYSIVCEINGYKMNFSINGYWIGEFDMSAEMTASNGATTDLAFIGRIYHEFNYIGVRNVSLYKGVGIDFSAPPVEETTAEETTAEVTTAVETTAAVEETTAADTTVTDPGATGDSAIIFAVVAVVAVLGVAIVAKRRTN